MRSFSLFLLCAIAAPAFAQNGDRPGEAQAAPLKDSEVPSAPILSPADSLKTFKLPPGFRIEVVATEPLIEAPVAMAFHPDGSLYVLEMRGFMIDVDARDQDKPLGRVSILRDTDGDGKMDAKTVFADGFVMPRALALAHDGLLVAEPPNLWFCRDTNGDGVSDEKTRVASDYGSQANPEHTANGLLWSMENWFYSANHTNRLRRVDGKWIQEPSAVVSGRGQWGLAQDDFGRLISNSNSDYLRGDLVPPELLFRNLNHASPFGANVQFDKNQACFPGRVNPGVNRAYQKGQLRDDGTLATFTGACGPVIYRGDQFDPSYYGTAFVCEPTANFIRCSRLTEKNGVITATNAFPNAEFLTSIEERFRPVNLYNAPDGALYVVDLHRGVLQHRIYLTTYLRNQYLSRGLDKSLEMGRIYRVVQDGRPLRKIQPLGANSVDLVAALNNANAWQRDTAQRLLVERSDAGTVNSIAQMARSNRPGATPLHALWTLHGMEKLDPMTLIAAMTSQNPRVRAAAMRMAGERAFANTLVQSALVRAAEDADAFVQLHAAFALGPVSAVNSNALPALAEIVEAHANEPLCRDAAISGLKGRELAFAKLLAARPSWKESKPGFDKMIVALSRAGALSQTNGAMQVLEVAAAQTGWPRAAMIDGLLALQAAPAKDKKLPATKPKALHLSVEPRAALDALKTDAALAPKVAALTELLVWPGKEGASEPVAKPLTAEEKTRFEQGKEIYSLTCAACHQPHGLGQEGLAPPLVDSEWATGSEKRLARIILGGLRGPIAVNGKEYKLEMPPLAVLEDAQIAAVMTYVRREWNHTASPITEDYVAKIRKESEGRDEPWTDADLAKTP